MSRFWNFLQQEQNRQILSWLGGGLVVAAAGLWVVFVYVFPPSSGKSSASATTSANCGGVAFGGSVSGSTITAGNTTGADCSQKK